VRYHFKVRKEGRGFWAQCMELEGCRTQATTRKELDKNMREALNAYLDEPEDSSVVFSLPSKKSPKGAVEVAADPRIAFAFRLRMARLSHELTQKRAAELIGMKGLYSYQRLESSKTANPEFETIVRIKKAFPEIDVDDLVG
jgi:antitoxin HicB